MRAVVGVDEVVVVLVHLDGRQLALVDDVLVGQRAEVEPIVEADGVSGPLAEDVQLSFEVLLVETVGIRRLGSVAGAVGRSEHDERLEDDGLAGLCRGAQETRVHGRRPPSQDPQAE